MKDSSKHFLISKERKKDKKEERKISQKKKSHNE